MPPLPNFVAAGEALTDLIVQDGAAEHWRAATGGSTWNVARVLARLGVASAFAGAISHDVFGDALWQASAAAGLDMRFLQRVPGKPPLLAVVHSTDPPRYFFVGNDSADLHFDAVALPAGWMAHAAWAHFGGISLARPPLTGKLLALAEQLQAAGVKISYDPNYRTLMDADYRPTLRRMVELASVVKVSDEDLHGLFGGIGPFGDGDSAAALARLRSWNPHATVLFTRGANGASLHVGGQVWQAAAPAVSVVDTVGAGDASIGALLFSLMQGGGAAESLRWAVAGGAAACLNSGASPPALAQIEALLAQVTPSLQGD